MSQNTGTTDVNETTSVKDASWEFSVTIAEMYDCHCDDVFGRPEVPDETYRSNIKAWVRCLHYTRRLFHEQSCEKEEAYEALLKLARMAKQCIDLADDLDSDEFEHYIKALCCDENGNLKPRQTWPNVSHLFDIENILGAISLLTQSVEPSAKKQKTEA